MAKLVFNNIEIYPANGTLGVSSSTKPRVKIPHIIGTGSNQVASGKIAKPVLANIVSDTGTLVDQNGSNGKVWRLREAVDLAGNNVPTTPVIACTITDITDTTVFPPLAYTMIQFTPAVPFSTSKYYELEFEDELEYVLYDTLNDDEETGGGLD